MRRKSIALMFIATVIFIMGSTAAFAADLPVVTNLEAPQNVTVELKEHENGKPYFELNWTHPQSIKDLYAIVDVMGEAPLEYQVDMKVGDGKWRYDIGETISGNSLHGGDRIIDDAQYDPINAGELDNIDIKANVYHFRVRYSYLNSNDEEEYYIYSSFSNVASIGIVAFYKNASSWATADLDKAQNYGLITDKIKNNMSGPITREEFAELATRFYEVYTGKKADPVTASTFTDTTNPEILKAYKLGIVAGVGNNKFAPQVLINREQMAAMLNRAVGVINPAADMSIAGAPTFTDENEIETYFVGNVKFMAKNGFIGGVGDNRFAPKDTCTREQAVLIALRVYETYKNLQD